MSFIDICTIENDIISSPVIYIKKKSERYWQGHVFIPADVSDINGPKIPPNFKNKLPAAFYSTYGVVGGKKVTSEITEFLVGKNIGRKNETTPIQQAFNYMQTLYEKKSRQDEYKLPIMLLQDIQKNNNWEYVNYPVFVQPKLDGVHLAFYWHDGVQIYTRSIKKKITQNHLKRALSVLENYPGVYVTGELWMPGLDRQEITSIANQEKDENITKRLSIYLFDCFTKNPEPYSIRHELLKKIVQEANSEYVKLVNTVLLMNREELESYYKQQLDAGMEGIIIRGTESIYEPGLRTRAAMKYKPRFDDEFIICGFKSGKGKMSDQIIFRLKCQPYTVIQSLDLSKYNDCEFDVSPAWTAVQRKEALKKPEEFIGRIATVSYDIISNDGVPIQPVLKDLNE